jgi:hypothetical protein
MKIPGVFRFKPPSPSIAVHALGPLARFLSFQLLLNMQDIHMEPPLPPCISQLVARCSTFRLEGFNSGGRGGRETVVTCAAVGSLLRSDVSRAVRGKDTAWCMNG